MLARCVVLFVFCFVSLQGLCAENRRFRPSQYAALAALTLANVVLLEQPPPKEAHWRGGILLDENIRGSLRMDSKGGRKFAALTSDILVLSLISYPLVADAVWDSWLDKNNADNASQLSLIATQAFLVTGVLRQLSQLAVGRERPFQQECAADPDYDGDCGQPASRSSFFSGHSAFAFTGAGLICSAHEHLNLKGGMAPCYVALGLAGGVAVARVAADKHYASDTIAGAAVGLLSGYFLPNWINYVGDSNTSVTPAFSDRGMGLQLAYVW